MYDNKKYEFLINLVGDAQLTRNCKFEEAKWEETYLSSGDSVSSADPCGEKEFYPQYTDGTTLAFVRHGSCNNSVVNRYQEGWSFRAVE